MLILKYDLSIIKKDNYGAMYLINIDQKMLNKMLANQTQQYIKRTIFTK